MTPDAAPAPRRVRLAPAQRIEQILAAAIGLVSSHGYYGLSLADVAAVAGLSVPGMLHYIGSKEGLLRLIVEQGYDRRFDPESFVATGHPAATHPEGVCLPAYLRYLVAGNAGEPELLKLYMVLGAEAASPGHPAHDYFVNRPAGVRELYSRTRWRLPEEYRSFDDVWPLVEIALATMDGLQTRLFRLPAIDLAERWLDAERALFGSPAWDGYR